MGFDIIRDEEDWVFEKNKKKEFEVLIF